MARKIRLEPTQLMVRYVLAVALIAVFVIGGYAVQVVVAKQGALDEEAVNISGRQRMLSQRIVLLSTFYNDRPSAGYGSLLADSVQSFELGHQWIMENAVPSGSAVEAHYVDTNGVDLDRRSRAFAGLARDLLSSETGSQSAAQIISRLEAIAVVDLLRDLDAATRLVEGEANARAERLARIQVAGVTATLLVLFLEILVIFYPTHRTMAGVIRRLRFEAWHDSMTGLANRVQFIASIDKMMKDPEKRERLFVIALDLDGFKEVNDTLGHPVGDQVLQKVGHRLESRVNSETRLADYAVARFGGDEFMITGYLPSGDLNAFALELAESLIDDIEAPMDIRLEDNRIDQCTVGASIGFSLSETVDGNIDIFLSNADMALYNSKHRGKGVATAFTHSMREAAETRHHLTTELKAGVKGMEFLAFFQPQVNLSDGRLVGVEALARWNHPKLGLVGPDRFMTVAEECYMIDALDGQIMLDAFQAFRQAQIEGVDLGKLSINGSGFALRDPDFCDLLMNVAAGHDIRPEQVTIEVLENIFIKDDTDPAIETIQKLYRAGFGVAIDDFGVGYSCLSKISRGEISAIKIDRSLVQMSGTGNMDTILKATAAMAQGIDATLLAEGIETEAQRAAMRGLGVEVGQGFLWSRPLPIAELKQWVQSPRGAEPWRATSA